jgi:hypothetical protein
MNDNRFKEGNEDRFSISKPHPDDPVIIVCPKCAGKATVVLHGEVKATCFECGYNATKSSTDRCFFWGADNPTDSYFGYDLWLRTDCIGHSLWAFNLRHLNLLESYVSATLRERSKDKWGWKNSSLVSRLPKWIKAGKNRDALLKAINKLKDKA